MGKYVIKIEDYKISDCQEILKEERPVFYAVLQKHKYYLYLDNNDMPSIYIVRANSIIEAKIDAQEFLTKLKKSVT